MKIRVAAVLAVLVACGADQAPGAPTDEPPSDAGTDATSAPPAPPPPAPDAASTTDAQVDAGFVYTDFSINHVLSTGQSNSVANGSYPPLSTSQPFTNLMFDTGVITAANCDGNACRSYQTPASLIPLTEGDRFFDYDPDTGRETMSSGLANQISHLAKTVYSANNPHAAHDVLVSLHGRSGNLYACLKKNGCPWYDTAEQPTLKPFAEALAQVESAKALASAAGRSYAVRAITAIHGESDHYSNQDQFPSAGTDGTPDKIQNYADALLEWQADYETSIRAITGQSVPIPLLIAQMNDWNDQRFSAVAALQYEAHVRAPGKVVLVTPTYMLQFQADCLHYDAASHRRLGEYFAKAYARTVFTGLPWEPVRPLSIDRAGAVLTLQYAVPTPPLVLDTETILDPGSYGFELVDDNGTAPAIASIALTGPTTVTITLAAEPSGPNTRLRYAMNTVPGTCAGPQEGPRGNLRDSDATPSLTGGSLVNWSAAFQIDVP